MLNHEGDFRKPSDFLGGKWTRKEDFEPEQLVTITGWSREQPRGQKDQLGLSLAEKRKIFLINDTNLRTFIQEWGDNFDGWIGKKFIGFVDWTVPNPSGGERGGVRVRFPKKGEETTREGGPWDAK